MDDKIAKQSKNNIAVESFQKYLRIPTVHPNPDYNPAISFLSQIANELKLKIKIIPIVAEKPVAIFTWEGYEKNLKSIAFNSHLDVVPVFRDQWTCDPFAAEIKKGRIYARGAQDMKCVGIQYLEAVRILKAKNWQPKRDLHIIFVPDEEIGGHDGMEKLVNMEGWKELNIGLVLDEGLASPGNEYLLFYGERAPWWIKVIITGETGHGSQFICDTVGSKLVRYHYFLHKNF